MTRTCNFWGFDIGNLIETLLPGSEKVVSRASGHEAYLQGICDLVKGGVDFEVFDFGFSDFILTGRPICAERFVFFSLARHQCFSFLSAPFNVWIDNNVLEMVVLMSTVFFLAVIINLRKKNPFASCGMFTNKNHVPARRWKQTYGSAALWGMGCLGMIINFLFSDRANSARLAIRTAVFFCYRFFS